MKKNFLFFTAFLTCVGPIFGTDTVSAKETPKVERLATTTFDFETIGLPTLKNRIMTKKVIATKKLQDGTVIEKFKVTQNEETIVFSKKNNNFNVLTNKGDSKYDSSYGVKAYSTIYYSSKKIGSAKYLRLDKVKGGWKIKDKSLKLSKRTVKLGTSGAQDPTTKNRKINRPINKKPTKNTFKYDGNKEWDYVVTTVDHAVGVYTTVKITRNKSSWTLKFSNNA